MGYISLRYMRCIVIMLLIRSLYRFNALNVWWYVSMLCQYVYKRRLLWETLAASRSVPHPTRLETRTKKCNRYASHWVPCTPKAKWNVKVWIYIHAIAWSLLFYIARRNVNPYIIFNRIRSLSVSVATRKVMIYAWARRSQVKTWWRFEAFLTCKSIVWPGYRGERPIESPSSWFLPKFPSG